MSKKRDSDAPGQKVTLNVGGVPHQVLWRSLKHLPQSRLGRLLHCQSRETIDQICDEYSLDDNVYFFDRDPHSFGPILNFYRTGSLHLPEDICPVAFGEELQYWGLEETLLEPCCLCKYNQRTEEVWEEVKKEEEAMVNKGEDQYPERHRVMKMMWEVVDKPATSLFAKIFAFLSLFFILLSIIALIFNSIPEFQEVDYLGFLEDNSHLVIVETVCVAFFTLEYLLRLIFSPNKCHFLRGFLNIIDLLVIAPFYISLIVRAARPQPNSDYLADGGRFVRTLRILRVLRVFKLVRHFKGLQILGGTIKKSIREIGLLLMFMMMGVLVFSSLCYFAEKEQISTGFYSIPNSFWWAIITMTTVGYGDMVPQTPFGKLVGAICSLTGILAIALPIPVIVGNFMDSCRREARREKILQRKAAQAGDGEKIVTYHCEKDKNWEPSQGVNIIEKKEMGVEISAPAVV